MKKMSYVSAIDAVLSGAPVEGEVAERLTALRGSLAKRSASKSGKPTKTQIANEGIKAEILDLMGAGKSYLISDMMKMFPTLAEYPSQKIVALVRQLVNEGKVTREVIKGKAYFTLA